MVLPHSDLQQGTILILTSKTSSEVVRRAHLPTEVAQNMIEASVLVIALAEVLLKLKGSRYYLNICNTLSMPR